MILNINLRTWKSCMALHTDILQCNETVVVKVKYNNMLLLVRDTASYMIKTAIGLQMLHSKMVLLRCFALHRMPKEFEGTIVRQTNSLQTGTRLV